MPPCMQADISYRVHGMRLMAVDDNIHMKLRSHPRWVYKDNASSLRCKINSFSWVTHQAALRLLSVLRAQESWMQLAESLAKLPGKLLRVQIAYCRGKYINVQTCNTVHTGLYFLRSFIRRLWQWPSRNNSQEIGWAWQIASLLTYTFQYVYLQSHHWSDSSMHH